MKKNRESFASSFEAKMSRYHKGKNLLTETDQNVLKRCVILERLATHTKDAVIRYELEKFGKVDDLLMICKDDLSYTRSCLVKMHSKEEADAILCTPDQNGMRNFSMEMRNFTANRFRGVKYHMYLFHEKSKLKVKVCIDKDNTAKQLIKIVEAQFQDQYFTSITPIRNNYELTGEAVLHFINGDEKNKAKRRAKENSVVEIPKNQ